MSYALYIDESGDFKEGENPRLVGRSLVAGWIADNDEDHDELRKTLQEWMRDIRRKEPQADLKQFHATEWRKTKYGRSLLPGVFDLVQRQKPFAVLVVQNRTASIAHEADSVYLDMLVDLIVNAIFMLMDARVRDALPLRIYVAERKGLKEWEIDQLVRYRFRALVNDSPHKGKVQFYHPFEIQIRPLKVDGSLLDNAQSRNRTRYGLMPELILADFLSNELFQLKDLGKRPKGLEESVRWKSSIFFRDPFWRDLQFFKNQGRWVDLILELESRAGSTWSEEHREMAGEYRELQREALERSLSNSTQLQQLIRAIDGIIRYNRDWDHAGRIIERVQAGASDIPPHLRPFVDWNLIQFRLMIANHTGDNQEADRQFDRLQALFKEETFHRTEFFQSLSESYNRHAVSVTDDYDFGKAEEILKESIALEKRFLEMEFPIHGQQVRPKYSDTLGKLLSTLGQLRTKQAWRDPTLAEEALRLFDQAETHLQKGHDPARQRNYRVEAYLAMKKAEHAGHIYKLLTGNGNLTPKDLLMKVKPNSFDMTYWLRWMLIPENASAAPYRKEVIDHHIESFMTLDGKRYPEMSILYYIGRIAWEDARTDAALQFWRMAAIVGREFKEATVLQTLALRPLSAMARHFPEERWDAQKAIAVILRAIQKSTVIKAAYFNEYFSAADNKEIPDEVLARLEEDIPYS